MGDARTAQDAFAFVVGFLARFPRYKQRALWLSGESYGGAHTHSSRDSYRNHCFLACSLRYKQRALWLSQWSHGIALSCLQRQGGSTQETQTHVVPTQPGRARAGHYVPNLALELLLHRPDWFNIGINLQGFLVGVPASCAAHCQNGHVTHQDFGIAVPGPAHFPQHRDHRGPAVHASSSCCHIMARLPCSAAQHRTQLPGRAGRAFP